MADVVLESLNASSLFDLTGVVAVVTGGGTVRDYLFRVLNICLIFPSSQGIGLMISSTLLANGASVYIIGPKQEDLDK